MKPRRVEFCVLCRAMPSAKFCGAVCVRPKVLKSNRRSRMERIVRTHSNRVLWQGGKMEISQKVSVQTGERIYRKITWRLLPFLLLCYMVAQIDRFNIGFAKLQFLKDLHVNDAVFGVAASMFAVGYVAFEVPSNLMLARIGVRKTLLRIMVLWGIFSFTDEFRAGGVLPVHYALSARGCGGGLFPGHHRISHLLVSEPASGRIMSLFVIAVPIAGAIGGPLAGCFNGSLPRSFRAGKAGNGCF